MFSIDVICYFDSTEECSNYKLIFAVYIGIQDWCNMQVEVVWIFLFCISRLHFNFSVEIIIFWKRQKPSSKGQDVLIEHRSPELWFMQPNKINRFLIIRFIYSTFSKCIVQTLKIWNVIIKIIVEMNILIKILRMNSINERLMCRLIEPFQALCWINKFNKKFRFQYTKCEINFFLLSSCNHLPHVFYLIVHKRLDYT